MEAYNIESFEVPQSERPTHTLGFLPFTGKKVDTITWAREEITICTNLLEAGREKIRESNELRISAVDEDGSPRALGLTSIKRTVTGIAHNVVNEATKEVEVLMNRVVGKGGKSEYPPINSAFITFERQIAAHLAVQVLAHHEPYIMSWVFFLFRLQILIYIGSRYIEVAPEDVMWANLAMNPYEQKVHF